MPKDQRTFTHEFKTEAVRLVQTSGKSLTQVARDLGIADSEIVRQERDSLNKVVAIFSRPQP